MESYKKYENELKIKRKIWLKKVKVNQRYKLTKWDGAENRNKSLAIQSQINTNVLS